MKKLEKAKSKEETNPGVTPGFFKFEKDDLSI